MNSSAQLRRLARTLLMSTALVIPSQVVAADLGESPPILSTTPVKNWSGAYVGVHVGGTVARTTHLEYEGDWDLGEWTKAEWAGLAGVQGGINWQNGNFVYGIEADISATSFDVNQWYDSGDEANRGHWDWLATVRGRAGVAVNDGLIYVTGGLAFVEGGYGFGEPSDPDNGWTVSELRTGIALGAGYEHAIDHNWSWKAEYLYVGLPSSTGLISDELAANTQSAHIARIGLNYTPGSSGPMLEAVPAMPGNWEGWYVGGNVAGLIGQSSSLEYGFFSPFDPSEYSIEDPAIAGGLQVGRNWQNGHTVFGVEADINISSFDHRHDFTAFLRGDQINTASWDWYSTLRVRAGLAAGNALGYVTGGVVIASPDYSFGEPGVNLVTSSPTQVGLAIGAGAEYALGGNWTARLEYLYLGLPEDLIAEFGGDTMGSFVSSAHMARLGVNYMFGGNYSAGSGTVLPDAIDWNGWYAGVVGSAMMVSSTSTEYFEPWDYGEYSITDWAGAGGVVAGFNMQTGNFVYGAEADWSWTSWDERHNFATDGSNEAQMSWLATARGRAGIAAGSSLLYVTGGAAFANMEHKFSNIDIPGNYSAKSEVVVGLIAGIGFEHDFGNGWSGRLEAMHVAFPSIVDNEYDPGYPINYTTSANMARIAFVKRM